MSQKTLSQKTVVVTGASSGAGAAIAAAFARAGANLVLAARREPALKQTALFCEDLGAQVLVVPCDVTDAAAVKHLAHEAYLAFGHIDVWVNNAGVLAAGPFDETPLAIHEQVLRTNLLGYMHGAHTVLPYFKRQGSGVIINNISVGGWFPTPYAAAYTASKYGLRGLGQALRAELHAYPHIHVCDLYPAFLDTPGMQHAANYTGRYLKPAPPVFDPQRVGNAAVRLALRPQAVLSVGFMSPLLRVANTVAPGLSGTATAMAIEGYLKIASPLPHTEGNVLEPVAFGTGMHGGWNSPADAEKRKKTGLLMLAGLTLGWLLLAARRG